MLVCNCFEKLLEIHEKEAKKKGKEVKEVGS